MSLRNVIDKARLSGDLVEILQTVDLKYELANVAHALEGSLVLFDTIKGYPGWRVLSGQCANRRYLSMDMDVSPAGLVHHLAQAIDHAAAPEIVAAGPCQEVVIKDGYIPLPANVVEKYLNQI